MTGRGIDQVLPHPGNPVLYERCVRDVRDYIKARLVPMQTRRFRLSCGSEPDANWLSDLLNRLGTPFGTLALLEGDNSLTLR
jgi:hypothetical protein